MSQLYADSSNSRPVRRKYMIVMSELLTAQFSCFDSFSQIARRSAIVEYSDVTTKALVKPRDRDVTIFFCPPVKV